MFAGLQFNVYSYVYMLNKYKHSASYSLNHCPFSDKMIEKFFLHILTSSVCGTHDYKPMDILTKKHSKLYKTFVSNPIIFVCNWIDEVMDEINGDKKVHSKISDTFFTIFKKYLDVSDVCCLDQLSLEEFKNSVKFDYKKMIAENKNTIKNLQRIFGDSTEFYVIDEEIEHSYWGKSDDPTSIRLPSVQNVFHTFEEIHNYISRYMRKEKCYGPVMEDNLVFVGEKIIVSNKHPVGQLFIEQIN